MNDAPIPFIAYFFITVTAGTLAYATYIDIGDKSETTGSTIQEETSSMTTEPPTLENAEELPENNEMQNQGDETQNIIPSINEEQPNAPNEEVANEGINKPMPEQNATNELTPSNPFPKEEESKEQPKEEQKGFFNAFGFGAKKGGKSRKRVTKKKNKSKKKRGGSPPSTPRQLRSLESKGNVPVSDKHIEALRNRTRKRPNSEFTIQPLPPQVPTALYPEPESNIFRPILPVTDVKKSKKSSK